jgi:hypothetical protein
MPRHREQDACFNCGLPAYARNLCEPCYRYERRTGRRRSGQAVLESVFERREHQIVRELEAAAIRLLLAGS